MINFFFFLLECNFECNEPSGREEIYYIYLKNIFLNCFSSKSPFSFRYLTLRFTGFQMLSRAKHHMHTVLLVLRLDSMVGNWTVLFQVLLRAISHFWVCLPLKNKTFQLCFPWCSFCYLCYFIIYNFLCQLYI